MFVVHCNVFVLLPDTYCTLQIISELFVLDKSGSSHKWFVVLTNNLSGPPDRRTIINMLEFHNIDFSVLLEVPVKFSW